jgi:Fe-S-cluster containining protein
MSLRHTGPVSDATLVQIVDAALLVTQGKSGAWLACKPGCSQCCTGVFAINQLDVLRLSNGLAELSTLDSERAARVRERAAELVHRLSSAFPGDPKTGLLDENAEDSDAFDLFANDEVCPVLDPTTGTCDLYSSRPMTCRVFGPPVRSEEGLGVCELCYHGATTEEIVGCEMIADPESLEAVLLEELDERTGVRGKTIVAFALAREGAPPSDTQAPPA